MLFGKKNDPDPDRFWKEYEEKIQEKVLAKSLGRYISGWNEYQEPLWGLLIATTGGFRFHHFPHEGWLIALTRITSGGEPPKEKTIFISKEKITSVDMHIEKRWWKKLLTPSPPLLELHYTGLDGGDAVLVVETEAKAQDVFSALQPYNSGMG
ncbi:MAG: hypothetical protein LBP29_06500 [Treponema sp.]|jgi:hypothetical protein|nr:hypothetical protein [Treponema sp.]